MSRATEKFDEMIGEVERQQLTPLLAEFVKVAREVRLEKHRAFLDARNARYAARRAQEVRP